MQRVLISTLSFRGCPDAHYYPIGSARLVWAKIEKFYLFLQGANRPSEPHILKEMPAVGAPASGQKAFQVTCRT